MASNISNFVKFSTFIRNFCKPVDISLNKSRSYKRPRKYICASYNLRCIYPYLQRENVDRTGKRCYNTLDARFFSSSTRVYNAEKDNKRPLSLMKIPMQVWGSPIQHIKNWVFSVIINRYWDETFTQKGFLEGAVQAIIMVSDLISRGKFDELAGLVNDKAIPEIEQSYQQLSNEQINELKIDPMDLFRKSLVEIGIIQEDNSDERFVEITVIAHGLHGFHRNSPDKVLDVLQGKAFVCNYRFIKDFTKGVTSDWTINQLNHFFPAEHTSFHQRF